jgi:uncharacterized protein (DUF4415 family)
MRIFLGPRKRDKTLAERGLKLDIPRVARIATSSARERQMISLRLPPDVIERWKATGPGWQTRMAEKLAKGPSTRTKNAA